MVIIHVWNRRALLIAFLAGVIAGLGVSLVLKLPWRISASDVPVAITSWCGPRQWRAAGFSGRFSSRPKYSGAILAGVKEVAENRQSHCPVAAD